MAATIPAQKAKTLIYQEVDRPAGMVGVNFTVARPLTKGANALRVIAPGGKTVKTLIRYR